jgi:Fe2+ transport system protein FeoA
VKQEAQRALQAQQQARITAIEADREAQRAEQEAQRADREAQRANQLAQRLRDLGFDPDNLEQLAFGGSDRTLF